MSIGLLLSLVGLALIDSTSIGTLGIPVFLLITPNPRPAIRLLVYLGTIAFCYFLLGVGLMLGLDSILNTVISILSGNTGYWIETVLGVGLFALSFRLDPNRKKRKREATRKNRGGEESTEEIPADEKPKWMNRLNGNTKSMVGLGILASAAEAATMIPYLAAIGIMTSAHLSAVQWIPILGGYSLIMILPALVLLAVRVLAGKRAQEALERLGAWIQKHSASALSWTLGIIGFFLARDGIAHLFFK
jgi:cytochrome c biogenesis protein CcdA